MARKKRRKTVRKAAKKRKGGRKKKSVKKAAKRAAKKAAKKKYSVSVKSSKARGTVKMKGVKPVAGIFSFGRPE
jgi:hypothetical protein